MTLRRRPMRPPRLPYMLSGYTTLWNDLVSIDNAPVETVGVVKDVARSSGPDRFCELLGPDATLDHGWYASEDDGVTPVLQLSCNGRLEVGRHQLSLAGPGHQPDHRRD